MVGGNKNWQHCMAKFAPNLRAMEKSVFGGNKNGAFQELN